MEKRFFVYILVLFFLLCGFVSAKGFTAYTPYYPLSEGPQNIISVCGPDISSCQGCGKQYRQDCGFYYANSPQDCKAFTDPADRFTCVYVAFTSKVQDPNKIIESCDAVGNEDSRTDSKFWCIYIFVPEYGNDPKLCAEIPDTDTHRDLIDECTREYAEKNKAPEVCGNMILSVDNAITCCLRTKYPQIAAQYIPSRTDLLPDFIKTYKTEYDDCLSITRIKPEAVIDRCEDVNCACLDPCNALANDAQKQVKCAGACSLEYSRCYMEEKTLFTKEKRDMYLGQSFFGTFSRKHCKGHSFLPDSAGDRLNTAVSGKITDTDGKPMPYMEVEVSAGGRTATAYTDREGKYVAALSEIKLPAGKTEVDGNVTARLTYARGGKNYYRMIWSGKTMEYLKKIKIINAADVTQDIEMDGHNSADESTNSGAITNMRHFSVIYTRLSEVTDFALTELNANIDYILPVEVYPAVVGGTLYNRPDSSIEINQNDANYNSPNKPDNREYHEFCHHILFSQWNGAGLRGPGDTNHGGYINAKTGDSYTEGFAEFCAMAVSKYKGDPNPEIYAGFGSLEKNYVAWSHRGEDEELAVAGILWDLYDDNADAGDSVSLPLKDLWAVLKVKRADFYEYYKALKVAFPKSSDAIDKVFIAHGFFADKNPGNKVRDPEEPYLDANNNDGYDAGETFVDYGIVEGLVHPWMQYDAGETIGKATNYERDNRTSMGKLKGSYIKAADPGATLYKVSIHMTNSADGPDYEYTTGAAGGLVYIAPLPEDLDAEITVKPDTKGYSSAATYKTTNKDYLQKYYASAEKQGFFDSFDFKTTQTGALDEGPTGGNDPSIKLVDEPPITGQASTYFPQGKPMELFAGVAALAGIVMLILGVFVLKKLR